MLLLTTLVSFNAGFLIDATYHHIETKKLEQYDDKTKMTRDSREVWRPVSPLSLRPDRNALKEETIALNLIGAASANAAEFHGIRPRMYIENLPWWRESDVT